MEQGIQSRGKAFWHIDDSIIGNDTPTVCLSIEEALCRAILAVAGMVGASPAA